MNDGYIKEKSWFKCTIDNTTYDCYMEYRASIYLSKPWVDVTVRKYTKKSGGFLNGEKKNLNGFIHLILL